MLYICWVFRNVRCVSVILHNLENSGHGEDYDDGNELSIGGNIAVIQTYTKYGVEKIEY